jgi:hypothetical protein
MHQEKQKQGSRTMNGHPMLNLEDAVMSTNADELRPIEVGVIDEGGFVLEVMNRRSGV